MTYSEFFKIATGRDHPPYGWQERLATSEACESRLIRIDDPWKRADLR